MAALRRHFLRLGARTAHCRIAGAGPALLMLHQSPQNSRQWLSLVPRFAARYTVIAPDTPGFGDSDPLPLAQPGIADLAAATLELADALGLRRFAVFGMHTGGLIGMHLAWMAPERVAALVVDGFAAFDAAERAAMGERYLPPFVPTWDGAHLRWLWCRMREQLFFFPWYDGRAASALAFDPPTPQANHAAVMDVLEVGDQYRLGYGAALRYGDRHRVAELRCPAHLLYRDEDVLAAHRARLPALPPHVAAERIEGGLPALHARLDAILDATLAHEAPASLRLDPPADRGLRRRVVDTPIGALAAWHRPGEGGASLHIHAPGEAPPRPLRADLPPGGGHAIFLDLPGHGASAEAAPDAPLPEMANAVLALADALAPGAPLQVEAHGAAAALALALAECAPARVVRLVLHTPWLLGEDEIARFLAGLPDPAVNRTGAHLLEAFQWARERHLLWPWLAPTAAARRRVDAPDPARVHADAVELLRLGPRLRPLFAHLLDPGLAQRIRDCLLPLAIDAEPGEDHARRAATLATELAHDRRRSA
jgi:pimeloyl-ACP methyl ester carboxylesterase